MNQQTFAENMTARGYEPETVGNGDTTATKGDATVRLAPLADRLYRHADRDRHNP